MRVCYVLCGARRESVTPYLELWNLVDKFNIALNTWFKSTVYDLNFDKVETDLSEMFAQAFKLGKVCNFTLQNLVFISTFLDTLKKKFFNRFSFVLY